MKFELEAIRKMEKNEGKNNTHVIKLAFTPYSQIEQKFQTSCSRNMTTNLQSIWY